MSTLLGSQLFVVPLFGLCVFVCAYLMSDKIFNWFYKNSLGNKKDILHLMDQLYIKAQPDKVVQFLYLISFGLGGVVFLALWPHLLAGSILGTAIAIVAWKIPKQILQYMWHKRCGIIVNQMVDGMTIMSNGISAGLSLTQSMDRVCENIKGPLAQEFNLVLNKVRLGSSVEEALLEFGERIPKPDVQMFVTSVTILKETGGNLAETFATITTTIRDRQKVEKKIEALTAQGIMQGIIVTLIPFLLLIMFLVLDPNYVKPLFTRPLGWLALFFMLGLQFIGGMMMKKVVTIRV